MVARPVGERPFVALQEFHRVGEVGGRQLRPQHAPDALDISVAGRSQLVEKRCLRRVRIQQGGIVGEGPEAGRGQPRQLIGCEEEQLVLDDRSADGKARIQLLVECLGRVAVEVIARRGPLIAEVCI